MKFIGNGLCVSGCNKYFIMGMEIEPNKEIGNGWGKTATLIELSAEPYIFTLVNTETGKLLQVHASSYATRKESNGIENYVAIQFGEE